MTLASRILLGVAVALLVVGVGLAVLQPGSLGDGSNESATGTSTTTAVTSSTTSEPTTTAPTTTTTSSSTTSSTSAPGGSTTSSSSPSTTTPTGATTTTTTTTASGGGTGGGGSGFADGSTAEPSDTSDGLANTGGRSLIFAGMLAGAAGLALRPRRRV